MNLLIVLLFGLTILLGTIMVLLKRDSKVISEISISMAFSVIILLVIFELIPHASEHIDYVGMILWILIGLIILKILDLFLPNHHHSDETGHIHHIGIVASIALVLHNIIEGMAFYSSLSSSSHLGILLGIGIGLHNIPMGMVIGTTLYKSNKSIKKTILISFLISLSTFAGGLLIHLFSNNITDYFIGIMLSLTIGMLIYIGIFEIGHHLKHQNKKNTIIGLIIGILVFILSLLFHHH